MKMESGYRDEEAPNLLHGEKFLGSRLSNLPQSCDSFFFFSSL